MTLKRNTALARSNNAKLARTLRNIARSFEKGTNFTSFTCKAVGAFTDAREEYANLFGFGLWRTSEDDNQDELWNMTEEKRHNLRVTLLCMAAALAETGDL
jgi:hypothetical protein